MGALVSDQGGFASVARREGMGPLEIRDVLVWKQRHRAGWQAAATFAGRDVHTVRMACDPEYRAATRGERAPRAAKVEPSAAADPQRMAALDRRQAWSPSPPEGKRGPQSNSTARRMMIVRRLAERPLLTTEIAVITGRSIWNANFDMKALAAEGLAAREKPTSGQTFRWRLTDAGWARLDALEIGE